MRGVSGARRALPKRSASTTSSSRNWGEPCPMASTTSPTMPAGSAASIMIWQPSLPTPSAAGGSSWDAGVISTPTACLITATVAAATARARGCGSWNCRSWLTTRPADHRLPPAARHQQMEPDRAPPVLVHHRQLARQAARLPDASIVRRIMPLPANSRHSQKKHSTSRLQTLTPGSRWCLYMGLMIDCAVHRDKVVGPKQEKQKSGRLCSCHVDKAAAPSRRTPNA